MGEVSLKNAGTLTKGNYVIIDGVASVVASIATSKPGKHGATKARIDAVGLIDGKKRAWVGSTHEMLEVPIIGKKNAQVLSINANQANVMDMETYETYDLTIPEEMKDQVTVGCTVLYWQIMNDRIVKQVMKQA